MRVATLETALPAQGAAASVGKAVLVHGGARDSYQLALALSEAGLLESLVTDLYWPADQPWAEWLFRRLPPALRELVGRRSARGLPSGQVRLRWIAGLRGLLLEKLSWVPFSVRRRSNRAADATLGRAAGRLATRTGAGLVAYSYFGYDAMHVYARTALLFQVHPHPETVRRILLEELRCHPECAASLNQEWELALSRQDFEKLVQEPGLAGHLLSASSFTKASLVEHGTDPRRITVVPYGVDLDRFRPARTMQEKAQRGGPLRLLFVGRINQRKGVKYLLEALCLLGPQADLELTICGRVVDSLELFQPFAGQVKIRPSVSEAELVKAYQEADLFVFPSVAEGFGQVLLEALASGLPILSTTHTAAPDLIEDGSQGWIVEPRRPDQMAERIAWAGARRPELAAMGAEARRRAETFTWERFRRRSADAVREYLATLEQERVL